VDATTIDRTAARILTSLTPFGAVEGIGRFASAHRISLEEDFDLHCRCVRTNGTLLTGSARDGVYRARILRDKRRELIISHMPRVRFH
jgi:hypothetical protein